MASKTLKIGILGSCPVCEGDFKVREGRVVHHGFTRPGDGMIHGDCFAVGYEPYERSTKGCEDYQAKMGGQLFGLEDALLKLPTRTYFFEYNWRREIVEYALGVTDLYTWKRVIQSREGELKQHIRQTKLEIERMTKRIADWKLADLREVTEEVAQSVLKAQRDIRKAEKDAKNAIKNAKAEALKAKRDAREAKREAAFQGFLAVLTAIDAAEKTSAEKKTEAYAAWYQFFSKKNERELGQLSDFCYAFRNRGYDALLLRVGLATQMTPEWVRYDLW